MAARLELLKEQFFALDGTTPLSGGKLNTYVVGTSTPKSTYTTALGNVEQANPVVLDSNGRIPSDLYGVGAYKFVIKDSDGNTIDTIPTVSGINSSSMTTIGDYSGDLDAAITAISSTATTLYVDDTATMSANTVVPSTCTIVLQKGGSIVQSTYNLTIQGLIIFQGGTISGTGALTVTGQMEGGDYQAISTTGTITIDDFCKSVWVPSLNVAVESGAQVVEVTANVTHTITATVDVVSNQTVYGFGDKSLVEFGANISGFTIDGKTNVVIKNFKIDGKKATYTTTTNIGIDSPANGTGSTNIKIEGMTIVDTAGNGIQFLSQTASHSENIKILNNFTSDTGGNGIICQDYVDDVLIENNRVINYGEGVASTTGIASGRDGSNTQIIGNYVEDGGGSSGASPHGISIDTCSYGVVANNIVNGAQGFGIEVGFSDQVSVTGNIVYGTTKAGITIVGDDDSDDICTQISVVGNTIYEPGTQGIYVYIANYADNENEDITIVGNTIHNPVAHEGVYMDYTINGIIANNLIVDAYKAAIALDNCDYVRVDNNMIKNADTSDTAGNDFGVVLTTCTFCTINGYLALDTAGVSTSGTGEDTLKTITIPQDFHQSWRGLKVKAAGTKTTGGGNKTIKLYWGSGAYTFNAAANDTNDWRVEAELFFTSDATQNLSWLGWNGTTPLQGYEGATEDLSAAGVILKITGTCADAGDTITIRFWTIELF